MELSDQMKSLIIAAIFIFFGLAMIQPMADFVYTLNTTALELLVGGTAAATLIGFIPFIFAAGVVIGGMLIIWKVTG